FPFAEHAVAGSAHVVIVYTDLGNREFSIGIRTDDARCFASAGLIGHHGVRHWLVVGADYGSDQTAIAARPAAALGSRNCLTRKPQPQQTNESDNPNALHESVTFPKNRKRRSPRKRPPPSQPDAGLAGDTSLGLTKTPRDRPKNRLCSTETCLLVQV